ncbi:MAG: orotate phosphoribosyltransferase [Candidatus Peribacteraceae bacterium]
MPHGDRIAEYLLAIEAVKLSPQAPFTWTSGIKSPIYCDNRMIYSHAEARDFVVAALANRVKNIHIPPDVIAGTATAAIGWGALVADRLGLPFVYVRSKPKEHGAKKQIEGDLKPGKHVLVIEDLISTGGSFATTVEALRTEGQCMVTDVVSIFSYDFDAAREKANELSVHMHPLATIGVLLGVATEAGRITEEESEMVSAFSRNPQEWKK